MTTVTQRPELVVVTDWAWWAVTNPAVPGVVTYYRDRRAAAEHADRCYYRYGRLPLVVGHDDLP